LRTGDEMNGLGETTAALVRWRRGLAEGLHAPGEAAGQMVTTTSFGPNPGNLRMLSHVPDGLPVGAPLVVVLHGCTQQAEAYAAGSGWLTLADRLGFAVLAPEQTAANNPNRCFNWFEPGDVTRGSGEAASICAMVEHLLRTQALDRRRVFVTGLSAGGAMTSALLAAYPDVFAAGAVIAGLPYGVANGVQQAFAAMQGGDGCDGERLGALVQAAAPADLGSPRVSVWHGEADRTVSPANAQASCRQWTSVHGLPEQPDEVTAAFGHTRAVWRSPTSGEVMVECNLIAGLGHGAPLAAEGADGLGAAAPYMLEAGVSSSLEIARFWGLAPAEPTRRADASTAPEPAPRRRRDARPSSSRPHRVGDTVMAALGEHATAEVRGVVAKALRSAGLLG
jgi:poly(hydroxyalkanoate) depolymerase family esterase